MSELMVEPDLDFIKGLTASGAETLKKCYQCATCSVVCNIAPEGSPFPRKEMVWAQWGLKDRIAADPDVWLCHNCGDCTTHCPRGAKPAEVLGALRKASIEKYAMIKPLAAIANKGLIASMIIPAIIIIGILAGLGHLSPTAHYSEKELIFNDFFPIHIVDPLFTAAFFFGLASAAYGVNRFWNDICDQAGLGRLTGRNALGSITPTIVQVFKHDVFANCGVNRDRKTPHLLALLSFIALAITTAWAVFYLYVMGMKPGEYSSLGNPLKWLGNAGAVALIVGSLWLIKNRKAKADKEGRTGSTFDWSLLYLVLFIGLTGFGAELFRLVKVDAAAYVTYAIHLILVLTL
ncbi:MAG TPA: quinone-interacting membrane-bound oxidoreductase complex subunit QmoC, partial [Nitrospirota bacterium]|nr:quinone-interacting membrane-bound oxidoreductase complex subunit QmoC [Nitrospirota bacterium]